MCYKTTDAEKGLTVQTDNTYHDSTGLLLHTDVTVNGTRQRVSSLTYDGLGRVIADTAVTGTSYTYDLHGRVTSISGPGFSQRLHYADGPGNRLYNGMISSMSWTMGNDVTERGYRYAYNDCNWLTAAEYGEGSSLDSHKNRYTERFTEFMPNGGVRRLQRHGLKADGEYGKIDNLHIYYEGNRIKEVLEDAEPTTQTGSTDFSGKTGVRSSFEYNSWGALVRDDSRNIFSVAYDNLGTGAGIQPCKFGGKELTLYNGLDEYDFGARQYYPAVPHFTRIDPKCEDYYWLSPYLYCANDPVNLTDPTGMSTRVKQLADGTYEVLGGDLTDDDKNIYLYNKDVNGQYTIKKQSIGITTSITSFYDSDNSMWKTGSIIDPNDKSGKNFLSNIIINTPSLEDYIKNAQNNHTYDFKVTNGTSKAIPGINIYRGMAIGFNSNGQTIYTSARDIGNIAAGYVAAANGLSWQLARFGFDAYQSYTAYKKYKNGKTHDKNFIQFEGMSTRNAELYGYRLGYYLNPPIMKALNLGRSFLKGVFSFVFF